MTKFNSKKDNRTAVAPWISDLPFAKKVFLLLSVTLGVALITASVVSGIWQTHLSHKRTVADLRQQAEILALSGGSALVFQDNEFATKLLRGLAAKSSFVAGRFLDANGESFATYPETAVATPPPPESGIDHVLLGELLDIWHPIYLSDQRVGSIWLRTDTSEVRRQVARSIFMLGIAALTALAIGLVISFPLQRSLTQPIGELARTAREVTRTRRYDLRAKIKSNNELGDLTDAFNGMLQHIEMQNADMQISQQQNKDLFDSAPIALWEEDFSLVKSQIDIWRAEGITDLREHLESHPEVVERCIAKVRIAKVNKMTLDTYKADSETLFRASLKSFFTPESSNAFCAGIVVFANGNTVYECQTSNRILDGQERQFAIRWSLPPSCENTWSRVLISTIDITDQSQARDELRRAHGRLESTVTERTKELLERTQDAEQLNRAMVNLLEDHQESNQILQRMTTELQTSNKELEAFSYSVSHDLRAPLRIIDGFSRILMEEYNEGLDEDGKKYLTQVCSEAKRMSALIDDMLTLSRITRREMKRDPVDLSSLAEEIFAELLQDEPERVVDIAVTPDMIGAGDPHLLRVALVNLLGNAWKFTGKTEHARIEFGTVPISDTPISDHRPPTTDLRPPPLAFFVRDNGAGFDMRYVEKLFVAFNRLHKPSDFPGTGIGLATVQRVIHRHHGQLWAEGEVGKGSTFYFTIEG